MYEKIVIGNRVEMADERSERIETIKFMFVAVSSKFLGSGNSLEDLKEVVKRLELEDGTSSLRLSSFKKATIIAAIMAILFSVLEFGIFEKMAKNVRGRRCLLANNYLVWEFTRPLSNCDYCRGAKEAIVLRNLTRSDFDRYAYTSRPIIVKNASTHWQAREIFGLEFFRRVYGSVDGDEAYATHEDDCQFLQFKSRFYRLAEVLEASGKSNEIYHGADEAWYVGWKNCHHSVLEAVNRYYENPHFLPADAEIPATNYIFLGYEQGAVMHLDYIPRLMWQAQILGRKTWTVAPTPECEDVCDTFEFTVDTGDIVLLDTRIWYHGTRVDEGLFSLSITSEYG